MMLDDPTRESASSRGLALRKCVAKNSLHDTEASFTMDAKGIKLEMTEDRKITKA